VQAPALTDTIKLEMQTPMGPQTQELTVRVQGDDLQVTAPGMNMTVLKDAMYIVRPDLPEMYAQFEVAGEPGEAMRTIVGFVPPQALRGETDAAAMIQAWTFNMLMQPGIAGLEKKITDGAEVHEIAVTSMTGEGTMVIDGKSNLVKQVRVHIKPPGAPPGSDATGTLTFSPAILAALEPPIAFDPAGREKVSSLEELQPSLRNKPAPDFTLTALDGSTVRLADLKGSVVVLDFWATWCVPCKRGLPLLQKFADWAKAQGKPVKVYAVNSLERNSPEQSRPAVTEYWKSQNFTMPTLLDSESTLAGPYMLQSIPLTLVIDAEGIVRKVHLGFNPGMVEELQRDVTELLEKPAKPGG
jgi:thiol-disulfide isomerase/thioredoxin